jgi:hypothetical protein
MRIQIFQKRPKWKSVKHDWQVLEGKVQFQNDSKYKLCSHKLTFKFIHDNELISLIRFAKFAEKFFFQTVV